MFQIDWSKDVMVSNETVQTCEQNNKGTSTGLRES